MEEVRDRAERACACCTRRARPYTAATPYATWRELLRQLLGVAPDDPDERRAERAARDASSATTRRCCRGCRCSPIAARRRRAVHARGRAARAGVPRRAPARGRAALPAPPAARLGADRGRGRAPHGRGVGRAGRTRSAASCRCCRGSSSCRGATATTGFIADAGRSTCVRLELAAARAGRCARARRGWRPRARRCRRTSSRSRPSARAAARSSCATCCARRRPGSTELPDSIESAALARLDRLAPRRPRAGPAAPRCSA